MRTSGPFLSFWIFFFFFLGLGCLLGCLFLTVLIQRHNLFKKMYQQRQEFLVEQAFEMQDQWIETFLQQMQDLSPDDQFYLLLRLQQEPFEQETPKAVITRILSRPTRPLFCPPDIPLRPFSSYPRLREQPMPPSFFHWRPGPQATTPLGLIARFGNLQRHEWLEQQRTVFLEALALTEYHLPISQGNEVFSREPEVFSQLEV